jgi:hypothetical protein
MPKKTHDLGRLLSPPKKWQKESPKKPDTDKPLPPRPPIFRSRSPLLDTLEISREDIRKEDSGKVLGKPLCTNLTKTVTRTFIESIEDNQKRFSFDAAKTNYLEAQLSTPPTKWTAKYDYPATNRGTPAQEDSAMTNPLELSTQPMNASTPPAAFVRSPDSSQESSASDPKADPFVAELPPRLPRAVNLFQQTEHIWKYGWASCNPSGAGPSGHMTWDEIFKMSTNSGICRDTPGDSPITNEPTSEAPSTETAPPEGKGPSWTSKVTALAAKAASEMQGRGNKQ